MILIALLALYVTGSLMLMFGVTFYQINKPLFDMNLGWLYFSIMGIAIFVFCFVGSVFTAQAQLFAAKDNELLLSLPVKPSAILTGRLASLLVLEYLFEAFIAVPAFVIWVINQQASAIGILFFIISVLVLPLAALAFAALIAWIIALITSRMRNKNVMTLILSLAFFYLYFKFITGITGHMNQLILQNGGKIADAVRQSIFPAYHLGQAIAKGSFLSLLIYLICIIAPFVIMVLILSSNFVKIATTNRGAAKIKYREKALKVSGIRTALTGKELRHFWSNPMYILNAALGGVFMLVGAVVLVINRGFILSFLANFNKTGIYLSPATLVILALSILSALNFVSAPSISLEGKNLWISKSLPIETIDVLMAKVQMHLVVSGIPAAVSGVVGAIALQVSPLEFFLILAVPLLLTLMVSLFGVVINLQFPKFDWINELQPIKQGVSVLITMFGTAALIAALAIIYALVLSNVFVAEQYLALCAALFAVLSGVLYYYLRTGGSRRFEALYN